MFAFFSRRGDGVLGGSFADLFAGRIAAARPASRMPAFRALEESMGGLREASRGS